MTKLRMARLLTSAAIVAVIGAAVAGCQTTSGPETTGSIPLSAANPDQNWRQQAAMLAPRYRANPDDPDVVIPYARALRMMGQRDQATAVLEQATLHQPHNKQLLGAYGRALAAAGRYQQALDVLARAHTPDQPDWRILSAQGAVLDQMGHHKRAQQHYQAALRLKPNEPTVLSNLGLSYALSKDLPMAEKVLREAVALHPPDPRVRQNLALVVGLEGRMAEAERIAAGNLPPAEATANVAYLKDMLAKQKNIAAPRAQAKPKLDAKKRHASRHRARRRSQMPDRTSQRRLLPPLSIAGDRG